MSELEKVKMPEFTIPEDVQKELDAGPRQCHLHGDYYGETCSSCEIEEKARDRADAAKRFEYKALGLPERYFGLKLNSFKTPTESHRKAMDEVCLLLEGGTLFMIMSGTVGTGKTHLASAALTTWSDRKKGSGLYTTAARMIRTIKSTWNARGDEQAAIDTFVNAKLLVIDEIGATFGSDTERMLLSEIISDRYNYEHPTILITNLAAKALAGDADKGVPGVFDERAIDRMRQGGKLVVFNWESWRKK